LNRHCSAGTARRILLYGLGGRSTLDHITSEVVEHRGEKFRSLLCAVLRNPVIFTTDDSDDASNAGGYVGGIEPLARPIHGGISWKVL
jgi:hypothetical protein